MSSPLDWYPEEFRPMGNMTSEGIRKQLGRSHLDPLTLLVRETVQNAWDARRPGSRLCYGLAGWELTPDQVSTLRDIVFASTSPSLGTERLWEDEPSVALAIFDRGTTGLTGPVRADEVLPDSAERDFVDFLLNIGQPRNTEFGGGTYGYGKSVLYTSSQINTILVHTRTDYQGQRTSRFMGAALGAQFGHHTGRHWWGRRTPDGFVEPATGDEADELSRALGFPVFGSEETGTTSVILLPAFGSDSAGESNDERQRGPLEAMAFMAASIIWNFWPKLLPHQDGQPAMDFELSWNGESLPLPDPRWHGAFFTFANAMMDARTARDDGRHRPREPNRLVTDISSQRPARDLGVLALQRAAELNSPGTGQGPLPEATYDELLEHMLWRLAPFDGNCSHVALMRDAELVVRYQRGEPAPEGHYAGVFVVRRDQEIDQAFADSEPPAHDDWEPSGLPRPASTFVRVALRKVDSAMQEFAIPAGQEPAPGEAGPLGPISELLGGLVPVVEATGPTAGGPGPDRGGEASEGGGTPGGSPGGRGGGGRSRARAVVNILDQGQLVIVDGTPAVRVRFTVTHEQGSAGSLVTAHPDIAVLDGRSVETEPPVGATRPRVLRWEDPGGNHQGSGDTVQIPASDGADWLLFVTVPGDTMVRVALTATPAAAT